ncbi:hypothetical protein EGT07_23660 [Herbaspirillum sp. HC18]|nr:hypothetical protein EGT07_23660 [Herbaspirillum sp. HC18]
MFRQTVLSAAIVMVLVGCSWNREVKTIERAPNPRIVGRDLATQPSHASINEAEMLRRELDRARQDIARLRAELDAVKASGTPKPVGDISTELDIIETKIAGIEAVIFRIPFQTNSAAFVVADGVGSALVDAAKHADKVQLKGRTDGVGSLQNNFKIAFARANAARNYLVKNGISPKNIVVTAQATGDYVAPNTTETGRAKNRRVDIVLSSKSGEGKT